MNSSYAPVIKIIAKRFNISFHIAYDIVSHIQVQINEVLYNESGFPSCMAVLRYYNIPSKYLHLFIW